MLIEHHAGLDIQDTSGVTALIAAVKAGDTEAVKQLLQSGASINVTDRQHKLAMDYARQLKRTEIVDLLNGSLSAYLHAG